jgi:DNA polymerase III delta prime subunit
MIHARLYLASDFNDVVELNFLKKQGADIEHFIFDQFGIDEARRLSDRSSLKPIERTTRDFLVQFSIITIEAQNALLKLFEEPPQSAVFHVVTKREDTIIPTLRSRLMAIDFEQFINDKQIEEIEFKNFLALSMAERMDIISKKTKAKDVYWIEGLVAEAEKMSIHEDTMHKKDLMDTVVFLRQYLNTRGSSAKMLLEHLALNLPVSK